MRYATMTPEGGRGSTYEAYSDEEATTLATADGYEVVDVQDGGYGDGYDYILVIVD